MCKNHRLMSTTGGDVEKVGWRRIRCVATHDCELSSWLHVLSQLFFQRYFSQKYGKEQAKVVKIDKRRPKDRGHDTKSSSGVEDGSSDDNSDPEESMIWKVMAAEM